MILKINNYIKKIFFVTKINFREVSSLVVLLILLTITEVLSIALIYPFIDVVINNKGYIFDYLSIIGFSEESDEFSSILKLGLIIIFIFFGKHFLSIFMRWRIAKFIWYRLSFLQIELMRKYQFLDYEIFSRKGKAELVNNLKELTRSVLQSLEGWLKLISEIVIFVFILIYLLNVNFLAVTTLIIVFSFVFVAYQFIFSKLIKRLGEENLKGEKSFFSAINETIAGFKEFRVYRKEKFFLNKAKESTEKIAKSNILNEVLSLIPRFLLEFLAICLLISLVLILLKADMNPAELLPFIGVFSLAALRIIPGINLIIVSLFRINYGAYALDIIYDDLISENAHTLKEKQFLKKIEFKSLKLENLHFKYKKNSTSIFEDLNFELKAYDCVGIVGDSGIGKTTLVDLMLGLLSPSKGTILINEKKLLNSELLYNLTSYLPQNPVILDGSIEKNIALENDEKLLNREKIKEALQFAELDDFVNKLPENSKTLIGENGINLSGGQNQRLVLARNYYFDREIIILDEATSALDIKTQENISQNIKILKNNKTLIIITHRVETLKNCNKVFKIYKKKLILDDKY